MTYKALLVCGLAGAALVWGQVVGSSLYGTVKDESGSGVPGVAVSVKNIETGAERKLVTDDNGRYSAPSISVGRYQVAATKEGFTSQRKTGIDLVVGQALEVDLTLPVGELKQVVTVEEAPQAVSLSTQQTSGLVGERQVKDLPLNGRSYDQLVTLNPGIVNYTAERSGGVGTSNSSVGNMFAVSGRRPQENLFLLNGIEYTGASEINNTPGRHQRPASGRRRGARVQRGHRHLRRRIRQASRRPGQHRHGLRHQRSHGTRLRIPAQQRSGRAQFLRSGHHSAVPAQQFRRRARADRSRRTSCFSSETTKASGSIWA